MRVLAIERLAVWKYADTLAVCIMMKIIKIKTLLEVLLRVQVGE
jgi:hypothetical protein